MDKLKMTSLDVIKDNVNFILKKFPNVIVEVTNDQGKSELKIDFDLLKQELSDSIVNDKQERYHMVWPDKKKSILLANSKISNALRPIKSDSVNFESTQNLYIEGDNLDVLKLLRETYLNKIKFIYIDPPYNTGNDFIYEDDYSVSADEYLQKSGQYDSEGNRMEKNLDSSGRYHINWLNMIYPRLKVARDLLADDGIMLISIGEQEIDNLKKVVKEIFFENNYIETYIWESTFRPDNSSKVIRRNGEYILCVAKTKSFITQLIGEQKEKEGLPSLTKNSMKESVLKFPANTVITYLEDGVYQKGVRESYELLDDVTVKDGIIVNSFSLKGRMIWGQEYLENELKNGTEIIIKSNGFVPYTKKPGDSVMAPAKLIPNSLVGDVLSANAEMTKLFDEKVFSYPKPVSLIKYLLKYISEKNFTVLDFFSGSSTTAQAVMELNAEDGGNRKFIMVQLPENLDENLEKANDKEKPIIRNAIRLCDKYGFEHTISSVAKERIRRVGKSILEDSNFKYKNVDIGFRVFKLDSSNMNDVYYNPLLLNQTLLDQTVDNVKIDRTSFDLLFQIMLDLGIELSSKIEEIKIHDKLCFVVNENDLVACLEDGLNDDVIKDIAKIQPVYAVFKDSSFENDSSNINCEQIFKTYSPTTTLKVI